MTLTETRRQLEAMLERHEEAKERGEAGIVGGVTLELDVYEQLLTLARRALESESRPQSQGVPTGERLALWDAINEYAAACGADTSKGLYGNTRRQEAVARVEAAYERGRSLAAGGGWVSVEAELPDSDRLVLAATSDDTHADLVHLEFTDDSEGHGQPYWLNEAGIDVPLHLLPRWRYVFPVPPSDSGKGE